MTALGSILAGQRATAAMLQGVAPDAAVKPADETVTNSSTLQNDNDLVLSLPTTGTWAWLCWLACTSTEPQGSGDIKTAWTWPTGATGLWYGLGLGASSGNGITQNPVITASASARGFGVNGSTETGLLMIGTIIMGGTAGSLQLQWAMNVAAASNSTTVKAGSWLMGWQIA